jgi:hypothetical protein
MTFKRDVMDVTANSLYFGRLPKIHRVSSLLLPSFYAMFILWAPQSLAQAADTEPRGPLTLFEAIDADEQNRNSANSPNNRREQPGSGGADETPEFSLMGTTRIGAKRSVLLLHKSGTPISLEVSNGVNNGAGTPIPKYETYALIGSANGEVIVQYPPSRPCRASEAHGITCDAEANRAILALAAADPLPVRVTEEIPEVIAEESEPPPNPFEALRQRAANGQASDVISAEDQRRFRPRRINADQVPDGMRVVSTPFGDRLVDI